MADFIQVGVIGLGKFGYKFGEYLVQSGVNVLGIDKHEGQVKQARNALTQVMQADATNKEALIQMGVGDLSHVLISVGDSIASSAMIAMFLKELEVPVLWAKVINADHAKLLEKVGVDEVIIPEHMAALHLAHRAIIPGFIDYFPFSKKVLIKEVTVQNWAGRNLRELDLTNRFGVQAIAIKRTGETEYGLSPKANAPLYEGDVLVVIGYIEKLGELEP